MFKSLKKIMSDNFIEINVILANINHANYCLQKLLPLHLRNICTVCHYENGKMIISLTNPVFSSELHYMMPELRNNLRNSSLLPGLVSIKFVKNKLQDEYKKEKVEIKPKLNHESMELLKKITRSF